MCLTVAETSPPCQCFSEVDCSPRPLDRVGLLGICCKIVGEMRGIEWMIHDKWYRVWE